MTHYSQNKMIKPRRHFNKDQTQRGFTLIELLVVVSIIALLSTLALSYLGDARMKARNTAKNSLVSEYIKALELYRSENATYPNAGSGQETTPRCIGIEESVNCRVTLNRVGDNEINSALNTFLQGPPASNTQISSGPTTYSGVTYNCITSACSSYILDWVIESTNQKCIQNAITTGAYNGQTRCTYTLD